MGQLSAASETLRRAETFASVRERARVERMRLDAMRSAPDLGSRIQPPQAAPPQADQPASRE
jgi:hypothetical protein